MLIDGLDSVLRHIGIKTLSNVLCFALYIYIPNVFCIISSLSETRRG